MPALLDLCEKYPRLQPSIAFSDRFVDLFEERIDIAVRIGAPSHWPASRLGQGSPRLRRTSNLVIDVRRRRPAAGSAAPASIAQLDGHDCIAYGRGDGSPMPWLFHYDELAGRWNTAWRRRA